MRLLSAVLLAYVFAVSSVQADSKYRVSNRPDDPYTGPYVMFDAQDRRNGGSVLVEWVVRDDVDAACRKFSKTDPPYIFDACSVFYPSKTFSIFDKPRCVVITGPRVDLWTLGHEIRHCFQGEWHGMPKPGTYNPRKTSTKK